MDLRSQIAYRIIRIRYFARHHPIWAIILAIFIFGTAGFLAKERASVFQVTAEFWHASTIVQLKVFAYGFFPLLLSIFGAHYAAKDMKGSRRKNLARAIFLVAGVLSTLIFMHIETKSETEHAQEVAELKNSVNTVRDQNQDILKRISIPEPDADTKEAVRRQNMLSVFRHEWILSHKKNSAGLLAGLELPPAEWVNQQLEDHGESWRVSPAGKAVLPKIRILYRGQDLSPEPKRTFVGARLLPHGLIGFGFNGITLKNIGESNTSISTFIYVSIAAGEIQTESCWKPVEGEKDLPTAYSCTSPILSPQEPWLLPALSGTTNDRNIQIKLKFFYGAKVPEERKLVVVAR